MKKGVFLIGACLFFYGLQLAKGADPELEAAIERRLVRLKRTAAARDELISERSKINSQLQTLAMQLTQAQGQVVLGTQQSNALAVENLQLQNELAALTAQATAAAQARVPTRLLENDIQRVRTRINTTNVGMTQLNGAVNQARQRGQALENQAVGIQRSLQGVLKRLDDQQRDFLDQADPFGRLSRAEHEAAASLLDDWLTADPENWGARMVRAFAFRKLGQPDEALADLTPVVESKSSLTPLALAARGELHMARGNARESQADLGQANKLDKKDPRIHIFRGLAHWREGKYQTAEADFKSAIRAGKDDVEAVRHAALLNAACEIAGIRDGRKAIELAERASELSKFGDWSCLDALAAAHAESGDFDEAARTAREASELTFGENRELCEARMKLYEARTPLRIKWK